MTARKPSDEVRATLDSLSEAWRKFKRTDAIVARTYDTLTVQGKKWSDGMRSHYGPARKKALREVRRLTKHLCEIAGQV